jgi:hypothetical protein
MTRLTSDRNDPHLSHGTDSEPVEQADVYLVLSDEELAKGFVRPVRSSYVHAKELGGCGTVTRMGIKLSETYARDPNFYGATYCCGCNMHKPVGEFGEFVWDGPYDSVTGIYTTSKVGT